MDEEICILGVDDRPGNLIALEAVLETLGVTFVKAYSGREALSYVLIHEFALILMDAQMPGMDGFETAERIRKNKRTEQIPIIFVTAIHKERQHVFRGYDAGAVDYLFKPLEIDILRSKVSVFIELFRQKQRLRKKNMELESANARIISQQDALLEKERREAIFQMAGATADELNSPLMTLMGNIDLMRMNREKSDRDEVYHKRIYMAALKIAEIVEKIRCIQQQIDRHSASGEQAIEDFLKKMKDSSN